MSFWFIPRSAKLFTVYSSQKIIFLFLQDNVPVIFWYCGYTNISNQHQSKCFHKNWKNNNTIFHLNKFLSAALQIRVRNGKLFFFFLIQNIGCGYSKEPSQWDGSFEHPQHMFKLMGKKILTLLRKKNACSWQQNTFYNLRFCLALWFNDPIINIQKKNR